MSSDTALISSVYFFLYKCLYFHLFSGHEKLQSDLPSTPGLTSWMVVTVGASVALGLFIGLIVVIVKKRKSSKVHPQVSVKFFLGMELFVMTVILNSVLSLYQSSHAVTGHGIAVIEQNHETIYSTVQKPDIFHPPANNTDSNTEGTIYDIPSRHVCYVLLNHIYLVIFYLLQFFLYLLCTIRCSETLFDLFIYWFVSFSAQGLSSTQCGCRKSGATAIWTRQNC